MTVEKGAVLSWVLNHAEDGPVVSYFGLRITKGTVQAASAEKIVVVGVRCNSIVELRVPIADGNFCHGRNDAVPDRSASGLPCRWRGGGAVRRARLRFRTTIAFALQFFFLFLVDLVSAVILLLWVVTGRGRRRGGIRTADCAGEEGLSVGAQWDCRCRRGRVVDVIHGKCAGL